MKNAWDSKHGYYGHGIEGYMHYVQDFYAFHKNDRPTPQKEFPGFPTWAVVAIVSILLYIILTGICDCIYG